MKKNWHRDFQAPTNYSSRTKAFFSGMGSVLVLGRRPEDILPATWGEALALDSAMLWQDFLPALVRLVDELPKEKRIELKRILLKRGMELDMRRTSDEEKGIDRQSSKWREDSK